MSLKERIIKSRKLVIALLLVLALAATSTTFAYWASSVSDTAETAAGGQTVTIGTGSAVSTTVSFGTISDDSATSIVPTSIDNTNDSITFTFPVTWDDAGTAAAGATGTLAVTSVAYSNGTSLDQTALDAMFSYTVDSGDGAITMDGTNNVVITVVFDTEPIDSATYDLIAASTLTVTVTFQVTAN